MRKALAGSITIIGACSVATAAHCQEAPVGSVGLTPANGVLSVTIGQKDGFPAIAPLPPSFDLADLQTTDASEATFPDPADNSSGQTLLDDSPYRIPDAAPPPEPITGPVAETEMQRGWADHVPREFATHRGFWQQTKSIRTETLLFLGYFGLQSGKKLFRETTSFHFHDEGWFGKSTTNLGVDKLTHAYDTYLIAEILHMRLHKNTNASQGDALTAAILASGLMALNEISDGIETDSGYSMQDITANVMGAAFSLFRNTVPGVREKVAFKIEIVPNSNIYSYRGQKHYEQQRYMLSFKGAGFKDLEKTPFRYLDFQVGYYASDFMAVDRNAGKTPKQHIFVGLGLNLGEIFFGNSKSKVGKAAYTFLDYFQVPYTSIRYDTTGHFGFSDL